MGKKLGKAGQMALGGTLAALAVCIMTFGALIPAATFCCPAIASVMLVAVLRECGTSVAWAWYLAVAVLSCLLSPDPEAAAVFVFLGYYPIIRRKLHCISSKVLRQSASWRISMCRRARPTLSFCMWWGWSRFWRKMLVFG